eukprot:scaffold328981_cov61-Tisochrysis_lutea.AAC.1
MEARPQRPLSLGRGVTTHHEQARHEPLCEHERAGHSPTTAGRPQQHTSTHEAKNCAINKGHTEWRAAEKRKRSQPPHTADQQGEESPHSRHTHIPLRWHWSTTYAQKRPI